MQCMMTPSYVEFIETVNCPYQIIFCLFVMNVWSELCRMVSFMECARGLVVGSSVIRITPMRLHVVFLRLYGIKVWDCALKCRAVGQGSKTYFCRAPYEWWGAPYILSFWRRLSFDLYATYPSQTGTLTFDCWSFSYVLQLLLFGPSSDMLKRFKFLLSASLRVCSRNSRASLESYCVFSGNARLHVLPAWH